MNSRFPLPMPGELFWSTVARYRARIGHHDEKVLRMLGLPNPNLRALSPNNLGTVVSRLPVELGLTEENVRTRHTLHKFYALRAGTSSNRYRNADPNGKPSWNRSSHISAAVTLRYCPKCRQEDLQQVGEAGWRLAHQLPGTICCHCHHIPLVCSNVSALERKLVHLDAIPFSTRACKLTEFDIQYAEIGHEFLNTSVTSPSISELGTALLELAFGTKALFEFAQGYLAVAKRIAVELPSVAALFPRPKRYAFEFLIRSQLDGRAPHASGVATLAGCAIYGITFSKICEKALALRATEKAPFFCTNSFAPCFRKPSIFSSTLSSDKSSVLFKCPQCGHVYRRPLPLQRQSVDAIGFEYEPCRQGTIPQAIFQRMWLDPLNSWTTLSFAFGVTGSQVERIAYRYDLPDMPGRTVSLRKYFGPNNYHPLSHSERKAELLALILTEKLTPDQRTRLSSLREYFRRHAPLWLAQVAPRRKSGKRKADLNKHERHFLKQLPQVKQAVAKHQLSGGRRVTPNVLRSLFTPPLSHQLLPRLPLLKQAFVRLIESREEYVERRFHQLLREGRPKALRITFGWIAAKCSGECHPPLAVVRQVRALWARYGPDAEEQQVTVA